MAKEARKWQKRPVSGKRGQKVAAEARKGQKRGKRGQRVAEEAREWQKRPERGRRGQKRAKGSIVVFSSDREPKRDHCTGL